MGREERREGVGKGRGLGVLCMYVCMAKKKNRIGHACLFCDEGHLFGCLIVVS